MAKKKGGGKAKNTVLLIAFIMGMIVIFKQSFLFFVVGLLPAIVAWITDRTPRKIVLKIVGGFNISGVVPYMTELWNSGNSTSAVEGMFVNANVWLAIYGAAAVGWGLILFMPSVVILFISGMHKSKSHEIQEKQKKLIQEWGAELKRGE